ncbi:23473_t:CDS:2, partial [Racocetra persica]
DVSYSIPYRTVVLHIISISRKHKEVPPASRLLVFGKAFNGFLDFTENILACQSQQKSLDHWT